MASEERNQGGRADTGQKKKQVPSLGVGNERAFKEKGSTMRGPILGTRVGTGDLRELAEREGQLGLTSLPQLLALSGNQASWSLMFLYACAHMCMHVCAGMHVCMASEVMDSASFFSNVAQDRVPDRAHSRMAKLPGDWQLGYPSASG